MLIDWFTVIAQVLNFLVLVWLLKRFLYRPILNMIDAREKRIADELADADTKKSEAEQQRSAFQRKNIEFDEQQTARMNQVAEEVKIERLRLLNSVRQESDELRNKLQLALKHEQLNLQQTLGQRAQEEVFSIVRSTLIDLAETSLEERMTVIFIKRLRALNEDEKANLKSALMSEQTLMVHTAFALSLEQSALIEAALKQILGDAVQIQFEVKPDVISGIEINGNGQKVAWSIADYLTSLTKSINQVMQSQDNIQTNKHKEPIVQNKEQDQHEP